MWKSVFNDSTGFVTVFSLKVRIYDNTLTSSSTSGAAQVEMAQRSVFRIISCFGLVSSLVFFLVCARSDGIFALVARQHWYLFRLSSAFDSPQFTGAKVVGVCACDCRRSRHARRTNLLGSSTSIASCLYRGSG